MSKLFKHFNLSWLPPPLANVQFDIFMQFRNARLPFRRSWKWIFGSCIIFPQFAQPFGFLSSFRRQYFETPLQALELLLVTCSIGMGLLCQFQIFWFQHFFAQSLPLSASKQIQTLSPFVITFVTQLHGREITTPELQGWPPVTGAPYPVQSQLTQQNGERHGPQKHNWNWTL